MSTSSKGKKTKEVAREERTASTFEETKSREEEWRLAGKKVDEKAEE
jgi:hypothetical protein